jgi:ribosomal protein L20A (L18A)
MDNFIQKQIEASERLYAIMLADHKARFEKIANAYSLCESLQKKLAERDEEIRKLKRQLQAYEAFERM